MNRILFHSARNLLIKHEGVKLCRYKCSAGYNTIGVGRNLDTKGISAEEGRYIGTQQPLCITLDQAYYLLDNDITETHYELMDELDWYDSAPDVVKIVLIDMAVNLGVAGLLKFTKTLTFLKTRQYYLAAHEMLNSKWASQVKGRAKELADMIAGLQIIGVN